MVPKFISLKPRFGVTLIEVLIVISILSILAVFGLTSFIATQKNARDSRRKVDLEKIKQILEVYKSDRGAYPPGFVGDNSCDTSLGMKTTGCTYGSPITPPPGTDWSDTDLAGYQSDLYRGLVPTYVAKLPVDPQNSSTTYYYYEPLCANIPTNVCGISKTCPNSNCCAYELGAYQEASDTWIKVCNP